MTPQRIEELRKELDNWDDGRELCELALDGLRFRIWIEGAVQQPGRLATLLAPCTTVQQYRRAIDQFIIEKTKGRA